MIRVQFSCNLGAGLMSKLVFRYSTLSNASFFTCSFNFFNISFTRNEATSSCVRGMAKVCQGDALTLYAPGGGVQSARISFFLRLLFFFSRKHAIKLFDFSLTSVVVQ